MSYHLPDVGEESVSKVLSGFNGELSRKVIDGAHEDSISLHTEMTANRNTNKNLHEKYFKEQMWLHIIPTFS